MDGDLDWPNFLEFLSGVLGVVGTACLFHNLALAASFYGGAGLLLLLRWLLVRLASPKD